MLKTALIAASLLALTTPALAANGDNGKAAVSVANVDFSSNAAVRDVYARLKVAATNVCTTRIESARVNDVDAVCVQRALADAVRAADRPQLTAMNNNESDSRFAARRSQGATRTAANPD